MIPLILILFFVGSFFLNITFKGYIVLVLVLILIEQGGHL